MLQSFNDFIWTYILVALLIACGLWFTWKTKFVQFRMLREMIRLLKDSGTREEHEGNSQKGKSGIKEKTKHITSHPSKPSPSHSPHAWEREIWRGWPRPSPSEGQVHVSGCGLSHLSALLRHSWNPRWRSFSNAGIKILSSEDRRIT